MYVEVTYSDYDQNMKAVLDLSTIAIKQEKGNRSYVCLPVRTDAVKGVYRITPKEYKRLAKLMFKSNEEDAHRINSSVSNTDVWEKKDLELLEGTEL